MGLTMLNMWQGISVAFYERTSILWLKFELLFTFPSILNKIVGNIINLS